MGSLIKFQRAHRAFNKEKSQFAKLPRIVCLESRSAEGELAIILLLAILSPDRTASETTLMDALLTELYCSRHG
jgi:hypothetical protein